jgi:hypothetical protein
LISNRIDRLSFIAENDHDENFTDDIRALWGRDNPSIMGA